MSSPCKLTEFICCKEVHFKRRSSAIEYTRADAENAFKTFRLLIRELIFSFKSNQYCSYECILKLLQRQIRRCSEIHLSTTALQDFFSQQYSFSFVHCLNCFDIETNSFIEIHLILNVLLCFIVLAISANLNDSIKILSCYPEDSSSDIFKQVCFFLDCFIFSRTARLNCTCFRTIWRYLKAHNVRFAFQDILEHSQHGTVDSVNSSHLRHVSLNVSDFVESVQSLYTLIASAAHSPLTLEESDNCLLAECVSICQRSFKMEKFLTWLSDFCFQYQFAPSFAIVSSILSYYLHSQDSCGTLSSFICKKPISVEAWCTDIMKIIDFSVELNDEFLKACRFFFIILSCVDISKFKTNKENILRCFTFNVKSIDEPFFIRSVLLLFTLLECTRSANDDVIEHISTLFECLSCPCPSLIDCYFVVVIALEKFRKDPSSVIERLCKRIQRHAITQNDISELACAYWKNVSYVQQNCLVRSVYPFVAKFPFKVCPMNLNATAAFWENLSDVIATCDFDECHNAADLGAKLCDFYSNRLSSLHPNFLHYYAQIVIKTWSSSLDDNCKSPGKILLTLILESNKFTAECLYKFLFLVLSNSNENSLIFTDENVQIAFFSTYISVLWTNSNSECAFPLEILSRMNLFSQFIISQNIGVISTLDMLKHFFVEFGDFYSSSCHNDLLIRYKGTKILSSILNKSLNFSPPFTWDFWYEISSSLVFHCSQLLYCRGNSNCPLICLINIFILPVCMPRIQEQCVEKYLHVFLKGLALLETDDYITRLIGNIISTYIEKFSNISFIKESNKHFLIRALFVSGRSSAALEREQRKKLLSIIANQILLLDNKQKVKVLERIGFCLCIEARITKDEDVLLDDAEILLHSIFYMMTNEEHVETKIPYLYFKVFKVFCLLKNTNLILDKLLEVFTTFFRKKPGITLRVFEKAIGYNPPLFDQLYKEFSKSKAWNESEFPDSTELLEKMKEMLNENLKKTNNAIL